MWNLRNKINEPKVGGKRGKPSNRLLTIEDKLRVAGGEAGGGWVKWVIGIKQCTCDEHWVMYGIFEPLYYTSETNITDRKSVV